jgi:hypothetical protein
MVRDSVKITIEAAAERFRLSARPAIGIVTEVMEASLTPIDAASTPLASLPKMEIYDSSRGRSVIDFFA